MVEMKKNNLEVAGKDGSVHPTSSAGQFLSEYWAMTHDNPINPRMRIWSYNYNDGTPAPLVVTDIYYRRWDSEDALWMDAIISLEKRSEGMGSFVLDSVGRLADKHGVSIFGVAGAITGSTAGAGRRLKKTELRSWYLRHGWEQAEDKDKYFLVRRPQQQPWRAQ